MMKKRTNAVCIYIAFLVLVLVWFSQWPRYSVMFGDDLLYLYSEMEGRSFFEAIFDVNQVMGKYRPVLFFIMYLPVQIFKVKFEMYQLMNAMGLALVAFAGYNLIKYITKNGWLSFACGILLITTPFNAYSVGVVFGMMEILCMLEIILQIICCIRYYETSENKWMVYACILFSLCIFTAERFMCLLPCFLVVILLCSSRFKSNLKTVLVCASFFVPILLRTILLSLVGVNSLETGRGSVFELISTIPIYLWREMINLAGFAIGDPWHGGFKFEELSVTTIVFSSLNLLMFAALTCYFVHLVICSFEKTESASVFVKLRDVFHNKKNGYFIILLVFFVFNLAPYALVAETHGEDRFLFPTYMILVCITALFVSALDNKKCMLVFVSVLFIFRISTDVGYCSIKDRTCWRYSYRTAQSCYDSILLKHDKEQIQEVYFVYPGSDYPWIFADQLFMKYYMNESVKSYYVNDLENIPEDNADGKIVYIVPNNDHQNHPFESKCVTYDELLAYGQNIE